MSTFYLVRHAHADWTPDEDRPLSVRGHKDAYRVADILQTYPIGAIYSSPSQRARQTIAPLAARLNLPVHMEPGLEERRLGNSLTGDFLQAVKETWLSPSFAHPGGESNAAAQERGMAVVRRLAKQHVAEHIVLSTHGNLTALILQGFDPSIAFAFWESLTMPDIYALCLGQAGKASIRRRWQASVLLRDVMQDDLPIFFEHQLDPDANTMAAFPPREREAFMAHWSKILGDGTITKKTILFDGHVAGNMVCFEQSGELKVGYWIGKEYWGKGVATRALQEFLGHVKVRPLYAHVAKHNIASARVLEKCGFTICGEDKGVASTGGEQVEELVLKLDAHERDAASRS